MVEKVTVALKSKKSKKYTVSIGDGLDCGKLASVVKKPCKAVIVSDDNVFHLYGNAVTESFQKSGYQTSAFVIKNGEASKTLVTITELLDFLAANDMTKQDMLVALGGGVVGDITGFASAIYLRGVDYIQLPTTILAAVDSSVGGKTGVDLQTGKNLVGAFHQPIAVFCDTSAFATLPKPVFSDGMAEVVKYGMISDKAFLTSLHSLNELPLPQICRRCVEIKADLVEKDEFDTGPRRLLNFGHTVGHAVEALSGYKISHGSAVAIGMTVITRASEKSGLTKSPCLADLKKALSQYELPTRCDFSAKELARAALRDKKRSGEHISLVIPREVGQAEIQDFPVTELEEFFARGLEA